MLFIEQLPPGSAVDRSVRGEMAAWSVGDFLAAQIVDLLAAANWQRGGGKGSRPKPVPRPDPKRQQRRRDYERRLRNLGLLKSKG